MRTTVTIDEALVRELLKLSKAKTKTAAVALAIKEHIRREKLKKLSKILGSVEIDDRVIQDGNAKDLAREKWLDELGKKHRK